MTNRQKMMTFVISFTALAISLGFKYAEQKKDERAKKAYVERVVKSFAKDVVLRSVGTGK